MNLLRRCPLRKISTLLGPKHSLSKPLKSGLAPPELDIPEFFSPSMVKSMTPHYFISKQGPHQITVITEQPDLPSFVTLVIYVKAGSSVECPDSAGYAYWYRNSVFDHLSKHPKIFANTTIDYDREFLVLKGVCMSYQVEEFVSVMAEALGPRALSAEVLNYLEEEPDQYFEPMENFMQISYGRKGMGNSIKGGRNYIENTEAFTQKAQELHRRVLNSENVVIAATGIYNKDDFYKLVVDKFSFLEKPAGEDSIQIFRESECLPSFSANTGFANLQEAVEVESMQEDLDPFQPQLVIGFEGIKSRDADYLTGIVLEALIGEASMFSVGGPGKNSFARAHSIMANFHRFDSVTCFNKNYMETGVFGIASKINLSQTDQPRQEYERLILQALDAKMTALQSLYSTLSEEEFTLTKFLLRNKLLLQLQKQFDRIDEHVKSYVYFRSAEENGDAFWDVPLEMDALRRAENVFSVQIEDVQDLLMSIIQGPRSIFHLGLHNCKLPDSC